MCPVSGPVYLRLRSLLAALQYCVTLRKSIFLCLLFSDIRLYLSFLSEPVFIFFFRSFISSYIFLSFFILNSFFNYPFLCYFISSSLLNIIVLSFRFSSRNYIRKSNVKIKLTQIKNTKQITKITLNIKNKGYLINFSKMFNFMANNLILFRQICRRKLYRYIAMYWLKICLMTLREITIILSKGENIIHNSFIKKHEF